MQLGPMQVVAIGFDGPDGKGYGADAILRELQGVRGRGVIRLVDALFLRKDEWGMLTVDSGFGDGVQRPSGVALRRLAGIDAPAGPLARAMVDEYAHDALGVTPAELRVVLDRVPPGEGVALVLFEHAWAAGLAAAVRDVGGRLLLQGILTRDSLAAAGTELRAVAEAEAVMEVADAVRCVPLLDALAAPDPAPAPGAEVAAMASAVAAETLRTLVVAGLIGDAEAEPALVALLEAGLLDVAVVERALEGIEEQRADAAT